MKFATLAVAAVALSTVLTGCAKARAATVPAGPPLIMPAPPPRVLLPVEEALLVSAPTGPAAPLASAPRVSPTPIPRRPSVMRPETEGRSDTAPVVPTTAASAGPVEPVRELLAVPSGAPAADQARVQALLKQAETDRKRVEYGRLSAEHRKNFDDSRRFSDQALEKLKERNVMFALSAAEKAATLAASLAR